MYNKPLVSSLSMAFKKATTLSEDAEEVKKEHRANLKFLIDDYMGRVRKGEVEGIRTSRELVDVIKADLLLLGEATERNEEISAIDQMKMSRISSVLDENDPQVQEIMDNLFNALNDTNDNYDIVPSIRQGMPMTEDNKASEENVEVTVEIGSSEVDKANEESNLEIEVSEEIEKDE